jgi:integrase
MPRKRQKDTRVYWKRAHQGQPRRAYADFRDFAAWGGRLEALKPEGGGPATTDPDAASVLYAKRLSELQDLKRRHPKGLEIAKTDPLDRFATYVAHHITRRQKVNGAKRASDEWIALQEQWLTSAAEYFYRQGNVTLRSIDSDAVRGWLDELRANAPTKGRPLGDATLRKYLDALGALFRRAVREGRVQANPVTNLLPEERPTAGRSNTESLEIPEAALYLEACRRWQPDLDAGAIPFLYELVATFLMTGGRESEVTGLVIGDLDLERDLLWYRPNEIRASLKTLKRSDAAIRAVPISPQLKDILLRYLNGPDAPAGPLLFPGANGPATMLTDFRKALDAAARLAGIRAGRMRTKVFRVTWVSARLQCMDNGAPISPFTVAREAGHGSLAMVQRVYGRLGKVRQRREHVEYRWEEYEAELGARLDGAGAGLSDRWLQVLAALPRAGATAKAWELAAGVPAGTFYYVRDRLVEQHLVDRDGSGRGTRFYLTPIGETTLRA